MLMQIMHVMVGSTACSQFESLPLLISHVNVRIDQRKMTPINYLHLLSGQWTVDLLMSRRKTDKVVVMVVVVVVVMVVTSLSSRVVC
jgi:hypothetical protein